MSNRVSKFGKSVTLGCLLFMCASVMHWASAADKLKSVRKVPEHAERGKLLVKLYQCSACHIINGMGARNGVSLDNIKRSKQFIIDQLLDPEEHVAKNAAAFNNDPNLMPSHQLTRQEATYIADYLLGRRSTADSRVRKKSISRMKTSK